VGCTTGFQVTAQQGQERSHCSRWFKDADWDRLCGKSNQPIHAKGEGSLSRMHASNAIYRSFGDNGPIVAGARGILVRQATTRGPAVCQRRGRDPSNTLRRRNCKRTRRLHSSSGQQSQPDWINARTELGQSWLRLGSEHTPNGGAFTRRVGSTEEAGECYSSAPARLFSTSDMRQWPESRLP